MNHRIQRQSETFAYRMAGGLSSLFDLSPAAQGIGGGGKAKAIDALPQGDSAAPYEAMAQAEANRSGYQAPKMKVTPGAPSGGRGGGGSSAGSNGGSGSGNVGAGGIMDVSRPLYERIKKEHPDADIGGYRPGGDGFDEHNHGALDVMHPLEHGMDPNQIMQEGFEAGAPWAIWQQTMHYPDPSRNYLMPDRGDPTQNHYDHVHLGPLDGSRS